MYGRQKSDLVWSCLSGRDPSGSASQKARPKSPRFSRGSSKEMATCSALTKSGAKCKNNCMKNLDTCRVHTIEECSICMDSVRNGFRTSCNHVFHLGCMQEWADTSLTNMTQHHLVASCPMCRTEVFVPMNKRQKQCARGVLEFLYLLFSEDYPQMAEVIEQIDDGEEVNSA